MLKPEQFDPLKLARYTVVRVRFYFAHDPDPTKLFIVLRTVTTGKVPYCICLKITSNTGIYEKSSEDLAGCVLYQAGELPFLPKKSAVQPDNSFNIAHEHFEREAKNNEYRIEGHMPDDFHGKLVAAIRNSPMLSPKKAAELLAAIDER